MSLKTAKVRGFAHEAAKKFTQTLIKHPRTTLGLTGGAIGGSTGAASAAGDNWGEGLGKSESWKKKKAPSHKKHVKDSAILGGVLGAGYGAFQGHRLAKSPGYKHMRDKVVAKTNIPGWAKGVKTKADAKSAMRAQARKHHPDLGGSEEKMKKINKEWEDFEKSDHFKKLSFALPSFFSELETIAQER